MEGPWVAVAEQVPFSVALSAGLPDDFLFAFWAQFLTSAACHLSEERSGTGDIPCASFLRWSDGLSC